MQIKVNPGPVQGRIIAPPSKSLMQRACAAALLHRGTTVIHNPGQSADDVAALGIIGQLGAEIVSDGGDRLEIYSEGVRPVSESIHCGESGLSSRLFTPIAALSSVPTRIQGEGSLLKRPMDAFGAILPQLDVELPNFSGYIPFSVKGPLQARSISVDGSISSQFLSGLLFALSQAATEPVTLEVINAVSKPYIDLTLQVLEQFGKPIQNEDYRLFTIDPGQYSIPTTATINIEGDYSGAAAWLAAGCINGSLTIQGLHKDSLQADAAMLDVLQQAGASLEWQGADLLLQSGPLMAFTIDCTDCPDLVPVLSILAACCKGESRISGLHRLVHKESNRAESVSYLLRKLGVLHATEDDTLLIQGAEILQSAAIDSHNDHRIVMAAAIAALRADGPITIEGAQAVSKSYPAFFQDLSSLGVATETL